MKTRLEILCEIHGQNGGTIHDFNKRYNEDIQKLSNREFFKMVYAIQLKRCHQTFPELYAWPENEMLIVFERMCKAIDRMTFNKDSAAFKLTCKALAIKHTYQAIKEYIQ